MLHKARRMCPERQTGQDYFPGRGELRVCKHVLLPSKSIGVDHRHGALPSCCAIGEIRKKTSGQSSARTADSRARTSRSTASRFFVLLSWFLFVPAQVRGIQDHCRHPVGNAIVDLRRKDVVLAAGKKVERAGVRPVVHD